MTIIITGLRVLARYLVRMNHNFLEAVQRNGVQKHTDNAAEPEELPGVSFPLAEMEEFDQIEALLENADNRRLLVCPPCFLCLQL